MSSAAVGPHHIGRLLSACACVRVFARTNHLVAILISYLHTILFFPLAIYVIMIPSNRNAHKCERTSDHIHFLVNAKDNEQKIRI